MKILGFTTSYPRSPTDDSSVFVHRLYQAIAKIESVSVAAPTDQSSAKTEERDGVSIRWFRYLPFLAPKLIYGAGLLPNLKRAPWRIFELPLLALRFSTFGIANSGKFDVIHANWILAGFGALFVKLLIRKPYVVTLRGSDTMLFKVAPVRWISGLALRWASAVTVVSEQMLSETVAAFPWLKGKCRCIENGVEPPLQSSLSALPKLPEQFILAVGSVIPRKRIELAIELLSKDPLKSYSLVICGKTGEPQYFARLQSLASDLGVSDRVHFLGAIPPDEVWRILEKAACFLTSAEYEGRPNAVLEALCAGTVVVAANIPAHSKILQDNKTALLFEPRDLSVAAKRISELLTDQGRMARLAAHGKEVVAGASWANTASEYLTVLRSAVAKAH